MNCKNCHNPWTIGRCDHCAQCVPSCPHMALTFTDGRVNWDVSSCQQCDTCLKLCPQQATPMAQTLSVNDVLEQIQKVAMFIEGITVSGGEATTQLPFLIALFSALKASKTLGHLSCLVDSNGLLSTTGWQKLMPVCDGTMIDLKAWDSSRHRFLTGRDNSQVKASLRWLADNNKLTELRLLVIPEHSDYLQHIDELAEFIHTLGDVPVRLNAFHAHGVYGEAKLWRSATEQDVEPLAQALDIRGIKKIILPALYL